MEKNKIRQPKQERSIDKKNKIICAAYDVFSDIGYYKTNTADIAQNAGVSTGIVYHYFKNKRDILRYVIEIYTDKITVPINDYIHSITVPLDFDLIINEIIELVINIHKSNTNLHNILNSLAVTDANINQGFLAFEELLTINTAKKLRELDYNTPNLEEKIHIAMNCIQSFAHEFVYDKHSYIEYDEMKKITANMIVSLFK